MLQPRVLVLVRVQGLGLVPAQGPQVRPVLRGFRLVAVVLAFLFTLLFSYDSHHCCFPHRRIVWRSSRNSWGE